MKICQYNDNRAGAVVGDKVYPIGEALVKAGHVRAGYTMLEVIDALREAGCDDGEILEVNQVCAYFNYSNRLLNGLGVTTEGDVIGYYAED